MDNMGLSFYNAAYTKGVNDSLLRTFDCGNPSISEYLWDVSVSDSNSGKCVTYLLLKDEEVENNDIKIIYAYATINTHSLTYYDNPQKYHLDLKEYPEILSSWSCAEIKMFGINKRLKHVVAADIGDGTHTYATIFLKMFLEQLYYIAFQTIGFQVVYLRANTEGEHLYRKLGFIDCDEFLKTFDEKAEGCKEMYLPLSNLETIIFQ